MNYIMTMPYKKPELSLEEIEPDILICQSMVLPGSLEDTYDEPI